MNPTNIKCLKNKINVSVYTKVNIIMNQSRRHDSWLVELEAHYNNSSSDYITIKDNNHN